MGRVLTEAQEEDGWIEGDAADFLGLDEAEAKLIDMKIAAAFAIRRLRGEKGLSQARVGRATGLSQPRIAAIEGLREGISLDQFVTVLLALGGSAADLELTRAASSAPAGDPPTRGRVKGETGASEESKRPRKRPAQSSQD